MKRKNNQLAWRVAALAGLLAVAMIPKPAVAQQPPSAQTSKPDSVTIHPEADRIFRETSALLSNAKSFSVTAEVWEDQDVAGHKVSTSKTVDVRLRRPNDLQVEVRSPKHTRGFWLDGHSLTILNRSNNLYGTIPVDGTIDKVLDQLQDKYGITFPLEDIFVSNPYAEAMPHFKGGAYFGKATILGTPCKFIAFGNEKVDVQLWVQDGAEGLPRKMVITYKNEETQPQFTAIFSNWKLNPEFPDETFAFTPPKGAAKVDVLPAGADLTPTGRTNGPSHK